MTSRTFSSLNSVMQINSFHSNLGHPADVFPAFCRIFDSLMPPSDHLEINWLRRRDKSRNCDFRHAYWDTVNWKIVTHQWLNEDASIGITTPARRPDLITGEKPRAGVTCTSNCALEAVSITTAR
jgi:hypothetical protein